MNARVTLAGLLVVAAIAAGLLVRHSLLGGTTGGEARPPGDEDGSESVDDPTTPAGRAAASARSNGSSATSPSGDPLVLDRRKRDAIRTLIWESLGQEPPDAGRPPKPAYVLPDFPPWPDGPSDSGPGIEPEYIQQEVRKDFFPLAQKCYADMSARVPDAGGSVVLAFDIVGNKNIGGIVEQVDVLNKSTLRDPEFIDCMRQSFLSVTFPPPEGGGMVTVEYPILFSPEDADD